MSKALRRLCNLEQLPPQCRLFVGLWPDESLQPLLLQHARLAQQQCGGRIMSDGHWHITVAFVGECNRVEAAQVIESLQGLRLSPLQPLVLSTYGAFRKAGVVWLGPEPGSGVPAVAGLHCAHDQVWERLGAVGRQRPEREYVPHVSLLRKAAAEHLNLQLKTPVPWHHQACYLIASFSDGHTNQYVVLDEIPLN